MLCFSHLALVKYMEIQNALPDTSSLGQLQLKANHHLYVKEAYAKLLNQKLALWAVWHYFNTPGVIPQELRKLEPILGYLTNVISIP